MEHNRNGTGRKLVTAVVALSGVALSVVGWLQLAPPSLGGQTSYAVITGNSMEPLLQGGDLAVIRRAPSYGEGDVAAYQSNKIHNLVLHRIIGTESERFVTKGDNNDFVDPEKPVADQLVGRLWFHVPHAGTALAKVRDPRIAAPLAALIGLIAFGGFKGGKRRGRRNSVPVPTTARQTNDPTFWSTRRKMAFGCAIGLFVLSAAGGAIAFTTPARTSLSKTVGYRQQGAFTYSATVDKGSVYDSSTVRTGEPVYLRVAKDLSVAFDYNFEADSPTAIEGEGLLTTTLAASNGWSRTIATTTPVQLDNGELRVEETLQVDELRRLVEEIQTETGVSETYYTLAFTADVASRGELAGHPIEESFSARMPFQLDSFQLRLDRTTDDGVSDDPTNSSAPGTVVVEQSSRGQVEAGGISIDVPTLRTGSIIGSAIALVMLVVALSLGRRSSTEARRIESRHGDVIVRVRSASHLGWDSAIEVEDFDALRKLAEAYETMILHDARKDEVFFTICESQIYFCRVGSDLADGGPPTSGLVALPLRESVTFVEDLSPAAGSPVTQLLRVSE